MPSLSVLECNLHQRQGVGIALLLPLKLQEIVIGAASSVGKLTTDGRTCVIYRATTRLGIQKLTCLSKYRVSFSTKHTLLLIHLRKTCNRQLLSYVEVLRQSPYVARCNLHALIYGTTVRGTIQAVVIDSRVYIRHDLAHRSFSTPRFTFFLISRIPLRANP